MSKKKNKETNKAKYPERRVVDLNALAIKYREDRAAELTTLANILNEDFAEFCPDVSSLHEAARQCRESSGNTCAYSMNRLIFRLNRDRLRHTLPRKASDLSLILTITLSSKCNEDEEICDPFQEFQLDTLLNGKHEENDKPLLWSWHLDRDDPGEGDGQQEFIHPCYHLQYGGKHMRGDEEELEYGNALILEPPRIAHPPMDAILGIDFILTNYFSSLDTAFREEKNYTILLKSAQSRIWRPYAKALAAQWEIGPNNNAWQAGRIWPQLADTRH